MNVLAAMRYLAALNTHGHFARAAQACHITQPALSNALRALEAEYGVVIVRRGRVFSGLTHEGQQVLHSGLAMLKAEEALRQDLSVGAGQLQGRLRMAAVPTAIPMLNRFAAMLRAQHPGITPVVLSMSSLELESGLEDLSLDLALGYSDRMPLPSNKGEGKARINTWPQYQEHYYLLCPAQQPGLHKGEPMAWADAGLLPLCLLTPDMHNRRIVDAGFAAAGCAVTAAMETNSVLGLMMAVSEGGLNSVLPGALVATLGQHLQVSVHPLVSPMVQTPIAFLSPSAQAVPRALQAALALLQSPEWQAQCLRYAGPLSGTAKGAPAA